MKRLLFATILAALVASLLLPEADAQTKVLRKQMFKGRVVNATVDSTIGINPRTVFAKFDASLNSVMPDSVKLVRVVKGDTAKFESRVFYRPFSLESTNPFRYYKAIVDTIARATPGSTTDTVVVATLTRATASGNVGYVNAGEIGYKLTALTGNGILTANANYVEVFLEFYYSNK